MNREPALTINVDGGESVGTSDELTADERAYFESRGETALPSEPVAKTPEPEIANDTEPDDVDGEEIETEDPDQPRDEKGRFVPKSAYLRVKEEAKGTSQKLAQVAAELIRMREREAMLREMAQPTAPAANDQPEPEIDPDTDIFGAYKQMAKKLQALESQLGQGSSELRGQIEAMHLQAEATRDMQSFAAKEPAFMDGYAHLVQQRNSELEALGISDPGQREQIIKQEARELTASALRSGQSAAERIWKLAVARGFQPKAKEATSELPEDAVKSIERINKGQKAATSLRNAGTTGDTGTALTPAKLAEMSDGEFSATRRKILSQPNGKEKWARLLGGG